MRLTANLKVVSLRPPMQKRGKSRAQGDGGAGQGRRPIGRGERRVQGPMSGAEETSRQTGGQRGGASHDGRRGGPRAQTKAGAQRPAQGKRPHVTGQAPSDALRLDKDLERAIREGHPWIYRDALRPFDRRAGEVVAVWGPDRHGELACLAEGVVDEGPIGVRVLRLSSDEGPSLLTNPDALGALLAARIKQAFMLRATVAPPHTSAYRLVHGEGDRLPGLVVDRYGDTAVMKLDGQALSAHRALWLPLLEEALRGVGVRRLIEKRGRGESKTATVLFEAEGMDAPERLAVEEHGMTLPVNPMEGQKTGLFLDHRESRFRVRKLANGRDVLNLYAYTGGFSISAGLGGARSVHTVDVAKPAIELAEAGWVQNGLDEAKHHTYAEDVPKLLPRLKQEGLRFGLIVADPPSFAPRESALTNALTSYRKLHRACLELLEPGGYYLAASCSSHVRREAFTQGLLTAAREAGRVLQLLDEWAAPADHPRLLAFPEGDYLKCLLCRVV